jgi:aspartyl-tRNA(Asn)/glutamyl-tRNA(Gln) amidotransferase subunit A
VTSPADILQMPVHHLALAVIEGNLTAYDVACACLERTRSHDPDVRAFLHVDEVWVEKQALELDRRRREGGRLGVLAGVPVAIKDSICTADAPTTCASRILVREGKGWRSPHDATAVSRLRQADAIIFGKTNLDELSMGSSTQDSAFFSTRNPAAPEHVPGGSSGGSAAAVAARMVPAALGSDTGGSIRQPASFTSIVGIKPTHGRVSRFGLVAFASSLDQIGPLASDVTSAARLLDVIVGWDERDATSSRSPAPPVESCCGLGADGLRVGVPVEYFSEGLDPRVERCVRDALRGLEAAGCRVEPVRLPHTHLAVAAYYVLATAEASSNLARFDGIRFGASDACGEDVDSLRAAIRGKGFGVEVKRRIMLGTYVLSAGFRDAYYARALAARGHVAADFERAFRSVDAIAAPTSPVPPWRLGEKLDGPLAMYLADACTLPASLAGLPALSVPCGSTPEGLPVGLQLIGPKWREDVLCRIAGAWECVRDGGSPDPEAR